MSAATILTGRVKECVLAYSHPAAAEPHVYLRVFAGQDDGAPDFEALQHVGRGFAACTRADAMRARLKPGTRIEAHGSAVQLRHHPRTGEPELVLTGVQYVRGGDTPERHEPTASVKELLHQLERRALRPSFHATRRDL